MYTMEAIKESGFNSFCDIHQFWMFTTASYFNSFCDKLGFCKVNDVLLNKYKVKKMITKKDIPTITRSCISAHCADFTFSEKVEALNFVVEKIINIGPSSPLYFELSKQKICDIINIICMRYLDVQELEYYGSDGNKLITDDEKYLVT